MMVKEIFSAYDGNVTVGGTDVTAEVRDISITGGTRDVEGVRCFGSGTNLQMNEKAQELIESSITYVKKDVDLVGYLLGGSDGSEPISYSGDAPRHASFLNKGIIYTLTDNTDDSGAQLKITLGSIYGVSKEMRLSTDTFLEETFSFKLKPKDYKEEYTSDRVTSPIT